MAGSNPAAQAAAESAAGSDSDSAAGPAAGSVRALSEAHGVIPPGSSEEAEAADGVSDPQLWRITTVVILGTIMAVLDTTIVNIALESLSRDLHTKLADIQWVATAYLLSLAAVIPVSGWCARRFGAKRVYLTSITMFTFGSVLCGLAHSGTELIAFRVVQGLGGGLIMPVGQMILVRAAGRRNLAKVMSAMAVPMVMGPVLGPTIGGLILDNFGWRWLFYVNVPIGVVAVLSGMRKLPTDATEDAGRLDLWGLALIATGLVAVTYGLAEIGLSTGDRLSHVVVPLVSGVCLVAAFVHRALRVEQPLLDVRLYLNRAFTAASVTIFCIGAALFGGMILMPLYFQTVRHEDAVYTGLLLIPRGFGAALATWMAARVMDRIGAGASSALGILIGVGFTLPLVVIGGHTSYVLICLVMALSGFGLGLATTPAMTAAYRALRPSQIHDASPQLNIVLRVGGSVGTAILTVVLQQHLTKAGSSLSAQAHAFGSTFWWVVGVIGVAVIPTVMLMWVERPWTSWARSDVEDERAVATVQMLEAE